MLFYVVFLVIIVALFYSGLVLFGVIALFHLVFCDVFVLVVSIWGLCYAISLLWGFLS